MGGAWAGAREGARRETGGVRDAVPPQVAGARTSVRFLAALERGVRGLSALVSRSRRSGFNAAPRRCFRPPTANPGMDCAGDESSWGGPRMSHPPGQDGADERRDHKHDALPLDGVGPTRCGSVGIDPCPGPSRAAGPAGLGVGVGVPAGPRARGRIRNRTGRRRRRRVRDGMRVRRGRERVWGRRSGRMGAARWWFARMRDAVRTARGLAGGGGEVGAGRCSPACRWRRHRRGSSGGTRGIPRWRPRLENALVRGGRAPRLRRG
jgi:hypothetical protein